MSGHDGKPRRLWNPGIVTIIEDEPPANADTPDCECCFAMPGCFMCKGKNCADCLDPECGCCSVLRHQGAEAMPPCEHRWTDEAWFCTRCGSDEPPDGALVIDDDAA